MKLGKKAAIGFVIGGVIALVNSYPPADSTFLPWQLKLIVGIALIGYGLGVLLIDNEESSAARRSKWIILAISAVLVTSFAGYYYAGNSRPAKKSFPRLNGIFEVILNGPKYSGVAVAEGHKLTLQIKIRKSNVHIDNFTLFLQGKEIDTKSIDMVCALMSDFRVIRCSTDLDLVKTDFEMFVDEGYYTIMYWFRDEITINNINDMSFIIHTDQGEKKIAIVEKK